jgi:hypothetical protein
VGILTRGHVTAFVDTVLFQAHYNIAHADSKEHIVTYYL